MPHLPNIPRTVFTFQGLVATVQAGLTAYFRQAGIDARPVAFSEPVAQHQPQPPAQYTLGCRIEEFSLFSLRRYQQIRLRTFGGSHLVDIPIRGPTRASVSFRLTLHHVPSGEIVSQESIWDIVDDPAQGESQQQFEKAEEILSVALSRAVGSVLASPGLQAILLVPEPVG